jgi:large subunit ribosomal protein L46
VVLTRPPILTRKLTDFENAYYFYQKRLNERLVLPFSSRFYFKHDTPPQLDWAIKIRERNGLIAREVGPFNGKSGRAWDDEIKVGDPLSNPDTILDTLLKDAEVRVSEDAEEIAEEDRVPVEKPPPRVTEADETGDVRRLDRQLDRTLYLVVKHADGSWGFPAGLVDTDENLHVVRCDPQLFRSPPVTG